MALLTDSLTIPAAGSVNSTGTGAAQRQLSVAGSRSVVPLVYGEDRIGALLLNVLPSANAGFIAVQCLWGFAVDSVLDVRLNDNALSAGSTLTTYTGAQVSVDPVMSMAFAAQSITYTQALTGFAYSVITIPTREFDGTLNITARVRGRRLYDPRKDSTAGGAGLHRLANPSTWEWSDNPALALGDFCASTVYGAGVAVDWTSVATTANACDALIGAPSEKRRTLGVSFQQPADVNAVAETLRAYAGCFLLPAAAGVKLLPDQNDAPVASYSHAAGDIAALEPLQLRDMGQVPTAVEVIYTDTSKLPWRDATAVATLAGAGTTRPYRLSQVRLPGVQRYSQALREATERLNKLALQDLTTAIEVFDIGLRHDLGDIVTVTHPAGLSAEPLRVTGITMPGPGRWRLALVRHSAAAYNSAVVTLTAVNDPTRIAPPGPPANVAGLSGTVAQGIITWTWTGATERDYAETQIRLGGTDWASAAPLWSGRGTGYLQRVSATGTYTLRARHVLQDGQLSVGTTSTAVTVAAGDLVQSEPGAPGLSQVVVELYQWASASQPADPSGTTSYNWSNALHSTYTGGNGWSVTVPANPGTAGTRLWIARKALSAAVGTATSSVSWTGGFTVLAAAINGSQGPTGSTGAAGSPGIKAATPTVWRWAASIPTISGTGTYTWSAADTGLVPSGWSSVPGAGSPGQTLYGASVQLVDAAGATTTPIDWSTASITARGYAGTNGSNGSNGATGATGQAGVSARRAYVLTTASSLGSGSVTSTGPSSLPANGSFSASSWASTPATPATGQVLYQSDGLYDPATNLITWTTPYISALKVGNLAALAVNTGALTVDGSITVSASGGVFSSNWSPGSTGWALTPTGAEFGAASIRGQLVASQIDTRNLTIRDAAGNVLFGAGTNLAAGNINPAAEWLNSNVIIRANLLPNGGFARGTTGWVLPSGRGFGISDSLWGRALFSNTVPAGLQTFEVVSAPFPVQPGEWYVIHGDSLLFAASGSRYFDLIFLDGSGNTLLDGPGGSIAAGSDFSASDANRKLHAVEVQAPAGAVNAVARFVVESANNITAVGCRAVKVERGRLPHTPYSDEQQAASVGAAADAAAATANTASTNATNALSTLATMRSNGFLDASEKPGLIREWIGINGERAGIVAQANAYGIVTERNAYTAAHDALWAYLTSLSPAWDNTTTDTPITPAVDQANWLALYNGRQALLNKIAEVAGQRAVWASVNNRPANLAGLTGAESVDNSLLSDSLIADPQFRSPDWWLGNWEGSGVTSFAALNAVVWSDPGEANAPRFALQCSPATGDASGRRIVVERGGFYRLRIRIKRSGTAAGVFWAGIHLPGQSWWTPAPVVTSETPESGFNLAAIPADSWQTYTTTVQIATSTAQVQVRTRNFLTAGVVLFAVELVRVADWADMISGTGKPQDNATVGATIGANLFGSFSQATWDVVMSSAFIRLAHINTATITNLSALTASMGTVTVDANGWLRGGQTDWSTGAGFFLGWSGGAYKFSIGDATNFMRWSAATGLELKLTQFSASLSGGNLSLVTGSTAAVSIGSRTVTASNGTAPYTYQWALAASAPGNNGGQVYLNGATDTATIAVWGRVPSGGADAGARVICTVTDSNGRVAVVSFTASISSNL
jgi:hypothetical protein